MNSSFAAEPLPYGFTVNRLNAHPPALVDRIGEAGEGRKFLITLGFVYFIPVPYARQYLSCVSFNVLRRQISALRLIRQDG
jgi:hypothetical protein